MDVEILSPQTHAILNRRLEFRKLPLPNFSIFFSPTLFKFPEIILSRRNYTIKINNVEHLSILAQAQKLAYKNIDQILLIYNLKRSRTGIKVTHVSKPLYTNLIEKYPSFFPRNLTKSFFNHDSTTGFINIWIDPNAEIHRFSFKKARSTLNDLLKCNFSFNLPSSENSTGRNNLLGNAGVS